MDLGKKYQDVFTRWTDLQVKTGQAWLEAVQKTDIFDPSLVWDKTIDAYETSIQGTLDAEVAGARLWFEEMMAAKGLPEETVEWVKQAQSLTEQFGGMQHDFVKTWFSYLRQIDVPEFSGSFVKEPLVKKPAAKAK